MGAIVNVGGIAFGGSSNQVGVFSGQNMQSGWDSNSPNLSTLGTLMGSGSLQYVYIAGSNNWMLIGQPTNDNDLKNNASPLIEGP
jgi:hypothetical protein